MENLPFAELAIAIHNADMHVKLTHCFVSVVNSIHKAQFEKLKNAYLR